MPRLRPLGEGEEWLDAVDIKKKRTRIGRSAEENDIAVWPRSVSGKHAELELLDGGGAVLHDIGSKGAGSRFGSFVGEEHFIGGWREVSHGDILCLGTMQHGATFRFEEDTGKVLPLKASEHKKTVLPGHEVIYPLNTQPKIEEMKDDDDDDYDWPDLDDDEVLPAPPSLKPLKDALISPPKKNVPTSQDEGKLLEARDGAAARVRRLNQSLAGVRPLSALKPGDLKENEHLEDRVAQLVPRLDQLLSSQKQTDPSVLHSLCSDVNEIKTDLVRSRNNVVQEAPAPQSLLPSSENMLTTLRMQVNTLQDQVNQANAAMSQAVSMPNDSPMLKAELKALRSSLQKSHAEAMARHEAIMHAIRVPNTRLDTLSSEFRRLHTKMTEQHQAFIDKVIAVSGTVPDALRTHLASLDTQLKAFISNAEEASSLPAPRLENKRQDSFSTLQEAMRQSQPLATIINAFKQELTSYLAQLRQEVATSNGKAASDTEISNQLKEIQAAVLQLREKPDSRPYQADIANMNSQLLAIRQHLDTIPVTSNEERQKAYKLICQSFAHITLPPMTKETKNQSQVFSSIQMNMSRYTDHARNELTACIDTSDLNTIRSELKTLQRHVNTHLQTKKSNCEATLLNEIQTEIKSLRHELRRAFRRLTSENQKPTELLEQAPPLHLDESQPRDPLRDSTELHHQLLRDVRDTIRSCVQEHQAATRDDLQAIQAQVTELAVSQKDNEFDTNDIKALEKLVEAPHEAEVRSIAYRQLKLLKQAEIDPNLVNEICAALENEIEKNIIANQELRILKTNILTLKSSNSQIEPDLRSLAKSQLSQTIATDSQEQKPLGNNWSKLLKNISTLRRIATSNENKNEQSNIDIQSQLDHCMAQVREEFRRMHETSGRSQAEEKEMRAISEKLSELAAHQKQQEQITPKAENSQTAAALARIEDQIKSHLSSLQDKGKTNAVHDSTQSELRILGDHIAGLSKNQQQENQTTLARMEDLLKGHMDSVQEIVRRNTIRDDDDSTRTEARAHHSHVDGISYRTDMGESVVSAVEKEIRQHTRALREEMHHLGNQAARSAASDELRSLTEKVAMLQKADESTHVSRSLEAQLQQHMSSIRDAFQKSTSDNTLIQELRVLQSQMAELREKSKTATTEPGPKTSTKENQLERQITAIREEVRNQAVQASATNTFNDKVSTVLHKLDAQSEALKPLETQLKQHMDAVVQAIKNTSMRDECSREELRALQSQLQSLRDCFISKQASDENTIAKQIQTQIENHTRVLRDEISNLRQSSSRQAAREEASALTDKLNSIEKRLGSSDDTSKSDALQAKVAATIERELSSVTQALKVQQSNLNSSTLDNAAKEEIKNLQSQIAEIRERSRQADEDSHRSRALDEQLRTYTGGLHEEIQQLRSELTTTPAAKSELQAISDKLVGSQTNADVCKVLEKHMIALQDALRNSQSSDTLKEELRILRDQVAEMRSKASPREVTKALETQIEQHTKLLRQEMRDLHDSHSRTLASEQIKTLSDKVNALQSQQRQTAPPDTSAHDIIDALDRQLKQHVQDAVTSQSCESKEQERQSMIQVRTDIAGISAQLATIFNQERSSEDFRSQVAALSAKLDDLRHAHGNDSSTVREELNFLREQVKQLMHTKSISNDTDTAHDSNRLALERYIEKNNQALRDEIRLLRDDTARTVAQNDTKLLYEKIAELQRKNLESNGQHSAVVDALKDQLHATQQQVSELRIAHERDAAATQEAKRVQQAAMLELAEIRRHREKEAETAASAERAALEAQLDTHKAQIVELRRQISVQEESTSPKTLEAIQRDVARLLRHHRRRRSDHGSESDSYSVEEDHVSSRDVGRIRVELTKLKRDRDRDVELARTTLEKILDTVNQKKCENDESDGMTSQFVRDLRELRESQERNAAASRAAIDTVQQQLNALKINNTQHLDEDTMFDDMLFDGQTAALSAARAGDNAASAASLGSLRKRLGSIRRRRAGDMSKVERLERQTLRRQIALAQRTAGDNGIELRQMLSLMHQQLSTLDAVVGAGEELDDDQTSTVTRGVEEVKDHEAQQPMAALKALREAQEKLTEVSRDRAEDAAAREEVLTKLRKDIEELRKRSDDDSKATREIVRSEISAARNGFDSLVKTSLESMRESMELHAKKTEDSNTGALEEQLRKARKIAKSEASQRRKAEAKLMEVQAALAAFEFGNGDKLKTVSEQAKEITALRSQLVAIDEARRRLLDAVSTKDNEDLKQVFDRYAVSTNAEIGRLRHQASEWERRASEVQRQWSVVTRERDVATAASKRSMEDIKAQQNEFLKSLKERDNRVNTLQKELASIATERESEIRKKQAIIVLRDALIHDQKQDLKRSRRLLQRIHKARLDYEELQSQFRNEACVSSQEALENEVSHLRAQGNITALIEAKVLTEKLQFELASSTCSRRATLPTSA